MNHVYVGLPIKEAREDIQELIEELKIRRAMLDGALSFIVEISSLFHKL